MPFDTFGIRLGFHPARDSFGRMPPDPTTDPEIKGFRNPFHIRRSVGMGGRNGRRDVAKVERLLGGAGVPDLSETDGVIGFLGLRADEAIRNFQKDRGLHVDGLITPGGPAENGRPRRMNAARRLSISGDLAALDPWPGALSNREAFRRNPASTVLCMDQVGPEHQHTFWRDARLLALMFAPFYLNDFVFLAVEGATAWLATDYASKLLALVILLAMPELRRAGAQSLPLRWPAGEAAILASGAAVVIIGADTFLREVAPIEVEGMVLFRYPTLNLPVLYWTDITFGLLLTAASEELVFRGVFAALMARHLKSPVSLTLISAVVFALIHWSHGVTSMVVAGIAGVVLMALYLRTGSVLPGMAAHYLVNLVDFA